MFSSDNFLKLVQILVSGQKRFDFGELSFGEKHIVNKSAPFWDIIMIEVSHHLPLV